MIGLLGGMSWESTTTYYRLFNEEARARAGGLHSAELLLWSVDFAPIAAMQAAGEWAQMARILREAAQKLEQAGARRILICTNTMHKLYDEIAGGVAVPVVHIVDATAAALQAKGVSKPVLLATRYTMEQDFYKGRMKERFGIDCLVPDQAGRDLVHGIIYDELCRGEIRPASKEAYLAEIGKLKAQGADGVIFGCTEVGLLLSQADLDLPAFDSTILHVKAGFY